MDITVLMQILAPALPFLLKAGDKALDGAITKIGEDSWGKAKGVWSKLSPKVENDPAVKKAVEKVAADPENPDRQIALKVALTDLLDENPDLVKELVKLMGAGDTGENNSQRQVNQTIGKMDRGSKAVASIENVTGNVSL
jgi:uncharacterized protein YneF (UPF0154 family)